jgi:two-component system, sensor histidine kinase YesM
MIMKRFKKYILDRLSNAKLRSKLIASFLILSIFPIAVIGLISYKITNTILLKSEEESLKQQMNQLNNSLDYFFDNYRDRVNLSIDYEELAQLLSGPVESVTDAIAVQNRINRLCQYLQYNFKYSGNQKTYYFSGNVFYRLYTSNESLSQYSGVAEDIRHEIRG